MKLFHAILCLLTAHCLTQNLFADGIPDSNPPVSIPFDQIGAVVDKQYSGQGLVVVSSPDGAQVRCVFQRLNGRASAEGLWLASTVADATGKPFRVIARALGRADVRLLALSGKVEVDGQVARFVRPELTEEYTVSVDGVRQDFVIEKRPAVAEAMAGRPEGTGLVRLELEVDGAKAEAMAGGARLVLGDGGRKVVYNRLKVEDVRGRELSAKLEVVSPHRLAVVLDDTSAEYPVRIDPTFSDANWLSFGGIPGVNGQVTAAVVDGGGNLYVGGGFTIAGNVFATNIAKWNGSSWSTLGPGLSGGSVLALAVSLTNLYAGGTFTSAGGVAVNRVAKWDGSSWSPLGTGMNSTVAALAVSLTNLYAGGSFTSAGGAPSTLFIAQWNGTIWSALGSGMNSSVAALAVSGGTVYAGGSFTNAGGTLATNIAEWNGTWSALGPGLGTRAGSVVNALAVSGGTVYAGGFFTNSGATFMTNVAQWNGTSWSALGPGLGMYNNSGVYALAVSGGTVYAGGSFTNAGGTVITGIAQWNGSSWSGLGSGTSSGAGFLSGVTALAISGGTLYAGGIFNTAGGSPANDVAQWSGSSWSALGSGINNTVWAMALSDTNLYVGGTFTSAGSGGANRIAQWNGSSWSTLGSGMNYQNTVLTALGGQVNALAFLGTNLVAAGSFTNAGGVTASNVAQWNGSSWTNLGTGMNGPVVALAVVGTNLFAGGGFTSAGGVAASSIAQWNGSSWLALGSGVSGSFSQVTALAVSGTNLFVAGSFTSAGGAAATNTAEWNGSSWSALGSGLGGPFNLISALAVSGTNLYAGGGFTTAGGAPATNIAVWNGNSWSPLGLGFTNTVSALASAGTNLFVGGSFTNAGGVPANRIAEWNGSSWSPLGSGMNNSVNALLVSGSSLFAGGAFTAAGTNVSAYVAWAIVGPPFIIATNADFGFTNGNSQFGFDISGGAEQTIVVQASTNLLNWVPLQTNLLSGPIEYFSDPSANNFNQRFYRLKLVP